MHTVDSLQLGKSAVPLQPDRVIVVDVESTCWRGRAPRGEQSEIIEIGVCVFDRQARAPSKLRSILVRPEHSKVSAFCTRLTTLTQEQLNASGIQFSEACDILRADYDAPEYVWASWGKYDRQMFEQQCAERRIAYPFSDRHVNIKRLHQELRGLRRSLGLDRALKLEGLGLQGTLHRGSDDAWNIARLLGYLFDRYEDEVVRAIWGPDR